MHFWVAFSAVKYNNVEIHIFQLLFLHVGKNKFIRNGAELKVFHLTPFLQLFFFFFEKHFNKGSTEYFIAKT